MPATGALGVAGLQHFELEPRHFGVHCITRRAGERRQAGGGGDQHKAQFVTQLVQIGNQAVFSVQGHFRLQVAADGLGRTQVFHFLVYRDLDRHHALPERTVQLEAFRQLAQTLIPAIEHYRLVTRARQVFPQLIGGERQHRRDPAHQSFGDMEQRGLAGATRHAVSGGGVLTVLDDIEVETAQLLHAEVVHLLVYVPEAVAVVGFFDFALQQQGAIYGPTIQRQHVFRWQQVLRRVEAAEIGEQEARGVADTPVGIGAALQDDLRHRHLAGIVSRRHPQAQDIGTQTVIHFLRRNNVAQGLGHLATVLVDHETVSQQLFVRRVAVDGCARQQG